MKKPLAIFNSAGDTIIEVMIVLAVLGMAFAISSATASRGLTQSRNAEEHSRGLGLLDAQVELLRAAVAKGATTFPADFCLSASAEVKTRPAPECTNGFYDSSIKPITVGSLTYFDVRVKWFGAGNLGPQQESFYYRINSLSGDISGGTNTNAAASQVKVVVNRTKAAAGQSTATCTSPLDTDLSGANVTLRQTNGLYSKQQPTGTSAFTIFNNLNNGTYKASLDSVPAGYERCPYVDGGTSCAIDNNSCASDNKVVDDTNNNQTITFKMRSTSVVPIAPNWQVAGGNYNTCEFAENPYNDGYDGCFRPEGNGGRMFAWRQIKVRYTLGFSTAAARNVNLVINYNQLKNNGSIPPPDYDFFSLCVKFVVPGNCVDGGTIVHLGVSNSSADWTPRSKSVNLTIPANATVLELVWMNNYGGDPNLQINGIQINNP